MSYLVAWDTSRSFIARYKTERASKKERKNRLEKSRERLDIITQQLNLLVTTHDGLLSRIMNQQWDLIEIYARRNDYQKRIAGLTTKRPTRAERLAIFDEVTHSFTYKKQKKDVRTIKTTLRNIFDMDNKDRNQFLLQFKQYRDLSAEKDTIQDFIHSQD